MTRFTALAGQTLSPRFYEKSASVANFNEVGAIPLGKDLDRGI
jgi:hypothetical protein